MFTWKPIYSELARVVLAWRSRQSELVAILNVAKEQGVPMGALQDENAKGKRFPLQVIDPFTFFAFFNRKTRDEHRIKLLGLIKAKLGLTSPLPTDFEGLPVMNPQKSWFFSFQGNREPDAIDTLWDFAKAIVEQPPEVVDAELFTRTLAIQQVGLANLTMGLFWMRPDHYLALDKRNRALLNKHGVEVEVTDWHSYLNVLAQAKKQVPGFSWSELSHRAYKGDTGEVNREKRFWLFQANPNYFDTPGALKAGALRTWQVNKHKQHIKPGDQFVIWQSGKNSGAYAIATVLTPVGDLKESNEEAVFRINGKSVGEPFTGVELRVDRNLAKNPILRDSVVKHKELKDVPIGRQGTNFALTEKQFRAFESLATEHLAIPEPPMPKILPALNIILYGPPGTGKTHLLRNHYMEMFTDRQAVLGVEERAAGLVKDLAWWEVAALALLDSKDKKCSVAQILEHPLVRARLKLSSNMNPRAMLWASLQSHTKTDCPNVKYTTRIDPLLFSKDEASLWSVDAQAIETEVPELPGILHTLHNPPAEAPTVARWKFTTFHQSFSYEDFVEGIKPQMEDREGGQLSYQVRPGIFKVICAEANANQGKPYALFIDEINRGNVASIFGELITLIEEDKRLGAGNALTPELPYSRQIFGVPSNLYIIGTMNTADRSVEALDTALRRRFMFIEIPPDPKLIAQPSSLNVDLRKLLTVMNDRIERLLDHDHCIGHAYFMGIKDLTDLRSVFANNIIPLLREYFYGNPAKVGMVLGERFVSRKTAKSPFAPGSWGADDLDEKEVFAFVEPAKLNEEDFQSIYVEAHQGV